MGLVLVFCLWQRLAKSVCLSDGTKLSAEKMEDSVKAESAADGGGLVNAEKEPEDTLRYRNLGWSNFTSVLFLKMDGGWAVSGSERSPLMCMFECQGVGRVCFSSVRFGLSLLFLRRVENTMGPFPEHRLNLLLELKACSM